jgi:hypothetical protein
MQLPDIVRQIGKAEEKEQVYIEDYVYTYLHGLGKETGTEDLRRAVGEQRTFPIRAALFGHAFRRGERRFYLIYGAASVIEELENGKNEEQIREEYFGEYELIGYVNIYGGGQKLPGRKEGYYIFYEKNEPMQNYLLSCYGRKTTDDRLRQSSSCFRKAPGRQETKGGGIGNTIRKFFYGGCMIVLAVAATSINAYDKMYGFVETAESAIALLESSN